MHKHPITFKIHCPAFHDHFLAARSPTTLSQPCPIPLLHDTLTIFIRLFTISISRHYLYLIVFLYHHICQAAVPFLHLYLYYLCIFLHYLYIFFISASVNHQYMSHLWISHISHCTSIHLFSGTNLSTLF